MDNLMSFISIVLTSSVLSAIISVIYLTKNNRNNLLDSLDTKSGWRKELFEIASSRNINIDAIYRIRASLRYKKHRNIDTKHPKTFDDITGIIIDFTDELINDYINGSSKYLHRSKQEKARIYARYLLKHHWEELSRGKHDRTNWRLLEEPQIIKETMCLIYNIDNPNKTIDCNNTNQEIENYNNNLKYDCIDVSTYKT